MRGLRRIDWNIDGSVRQDRIVGDRPQRSALGENRNAVALTDAKTIKSQRDIPDALEQSLGCHADPRLVLLKPQCLSIRAGCDRLLEQFNKRLWLVISHLFVLCLRLNR